MDHRCIPDRFPAVSLRIRKLSAAVSLADPATAHRTTPKPAFVTRILFVIVPTF